MVDREARDRYAEILRHFASGCITNHEYEERFESLIDTATIRDDALDAIWRDIWPLYSDLSPHRLTGARKLDRAQRTEVARLILFLYSDLEYEWPTESCAGCLLDLLTFGALHHITRSQRSARIQKIGDLNAWPFIRQEDMEAERTRPRLLNGSAS